MASFKDSKLNTLLRDPIWNRHDLAEAMARQYLSEALAKIVEVMRDPNNAPALQMKAALELISRGFGKPAVAIRISSDKDKEDAERYIEGELAEAEEKSRMIMEMAKLGGTRPEDWITPTPQAFQILGPNSN